MKRNRKCDPYASKNHSTEPQMLYFVSKNFKIALITMFKEQKNTMLKKLKEGMLALIQQIQNINKQMEIIKNNQTENLVSKKVKITE